MWYLEFEFSLRYPVLELLHCPSQQCNADLYILEEKRETNSPGWVFLKRKNKSSMIIWPFVYKSCVASPDL